MAMEVIEQPDRALDEGDVGTADVGEVLLHRHHAIHHACDLEGEVAMPLPVHREVQDLEQDGSKRQETRGLHLPSELG